MSVAYFITVNSEDPGFDVFVDGKTLARELETVNRIASELGLNAVEDFAAQDLSDFGGPDSSDTWFDASEGVQWASAIRERLDSDLNVSAGDDALIEDIDDYLRVLREAEKRSLKWRLELDF